MTAQSFTADPAAHAVELDRECSVSAALARIGRELMGTRSPRDLLDELCCLAAEVLYGDASSALLRDKKSGAFVPAAEHQAATPHVPCALPDADTVAEIIGRFADRNVTELEQVATDTAANGKSRWLCIALRKASRLRAIVVVGRSRGAFGEAERRIAEGISQLGSLALENALLVEELERANRVKSDFVATMSHELRTPLNIILGYLSLVEEGDFGPLSDGQREILGLVDRNAHALLELVQDTLDLSQLEHEDMPVHRSAASLGDVLATLDRETRKLPRKGDVTLSWTAESESPALHTDHGKLKIALRAVIANALKFTERGTVAISAREHGDGIEFAVADTGVGIPRGSFGRIFEPFTQLGATSTRTYGGVGLGLYIARRLVELLGGTIDVASSVGSGSTFTIWIPAMAGMATNDPAASPTGNIPSHAEELS